MTPVKPDYAGKLAELREFMQAEGVPPWVKSACLCLSERQKELFCWVPEIEGASGAARLLPGLHASDFLNELLTAFRAFDWPRIIVLIHGAGESR